MSYKFTKTHNPNNQFDVTDVTIELMCGETTREELLQAFKEFLLACGFSVRGEIEVVEED